MTDLLQTVDQELSPKAQGGTIVLDAALFDNNEDLKALLASSFADAKGEVHIKSVSAYKYTPGQSIYFQGIGDSVPFTGMTIDEVTITVDNSDSGTPVPQIALQASPPADWTLSEAFPSIESPAVKLLTYENPVFYWASYTNEADDTIEGYYFQGVIQLVGPFAMLNTFLSKLPDLTVSGKIEMVGSASAADATLNQYLPSGLLALDVATDDVSLGPLSLMSLQLQMILAPYFNEYDKRWQLANHLALTSQINFMDFGVVFTADFQDPQSNILFEADLDLDLGGAIADLAKFAGVESSALAIPHFPLQHPSTIQLQDVKLSYNPKAKAEESSINFIAIDMGTAQGEKWTLWNDVYLESIVVNFMFQPKQGPGGKTLVLGQFSGVVSEWLSLTATFASDGHYTFYGSEVKTTSIGTLYKMFAGEENKDLPALNISDLVVKVDKPPSTPPSFEGGLEVEGEWEIVNSPVSVSLRGLRFHIQTEVDGGERKTAVLAGGMLDVGDYQFSALAGYSTEEGWKFKGSMDLLGDSHNISTFKDALHTTFNLQTANMPALPSALLDWYIQHIEVEFQSKSNPKTTDFTFTCELKNADIPEIDVTFTFQLDTDPGGYKLKFEGSAIYTSQSERKPVVIEVDLGFETDSHTKTSSITAAYKGLQNPPSLMDLLQAIATDLKMEADLPKSLGFDATLNGLAVKVLKKGTESAEAALAADFTLTIGGSPWEIYLAYTNDTKFGTESAKVGTKRAYVLGAALAGTIDLSHLPLVGDIPGVKTLRIDKLGFYYTDATFNPPNTKLTFEVPEQESKNNLAPTGDESTLTHKGFSLMAVFGNHTGDDSSPLSGLGALQMPVNTGEVTPPKPPAFAKEASVPQDPIKWLNINKTFGPVGLQKIGFSYGKPQKSGSLGDVGFYLDGTFQLAGFSMALDRLGVSFPVPGPGASFNPISDLHFHLGGLFVNYQGPSFHIGGGFVTLPGGSVNFIGEFVVNVGTFGLQAYGGFSNELSSPSLFIFAHLEAPLGGPPFFFITGLAGGFGVNRDFKLPDFNQLTSYPLLPSNSRIPTGSDLTGDPQKQLETMTKALISLSRYIPVKQGSYWLAAGVDVTSFEMITISGVLSVVFGVDFKIGLVGNANMSLPPTEGTVPGLAYLSIDFEVEVLPSQGLFAAFGELTPDSYVYAPFVHLMGGFAFMLWFGGPHEGDFVLTFGGYNPRYEKPSNYPNVQRLGMRFSLASLNVTGGAYFALTPGAMMAGFGISATWSLGPLEASFDAGMDFLINWKPFHYFADGYIHIAVSLVIKVWFVHIRITIHVGVDLDVWGPPFGGQAKVDLDIVSFTIHFGASQQQPQPLEWHEVQGMLPANDSKKAEQPKPMMADAFVANAAPSRMEAADAPPASAATNVGVDVKGFLKKYSDSDRIDGLDWLVNPNEFEFISTTSVPSTDGEIIIATGKTPHITAKTLNLSDEIKTPGFKYITTDPNKMKAEIKEQIEANKKNYPFFAYDPPATGNSWDQNVYGMAMMDINEVVTTHYLTIEKIDPEDPAKREPVNDLIYVLTTKQVPTSFWGTSGTNQANEGLNGSKQSIENAFTGFRVLPAYFFPARTSAITYYDLIFDTNNLFLYKSEQDVEDVPPVKTADYSANQKETIETNMKNGDLFKTSGTGAARAAVVTTLGGLSGFSHLKLEQDTALNTENYVDFPVLCYMSNTDEDSFGAG